MGRGKPFNLHARKYLLTSGKTVTTFLYTINPESGVPPELCEARKTTGRSSRSAAERFVLARIQKLLAGDRPADSAGTTLGDFLEPYYDWDRCPRCRRITDEGGHMTRRYARDARAALVNHVLQDEVCLVPLQDLRRSHLLGFRERLTRTARPAIAQKAMKVLSSCLAEAEYRQLIERSPAHSIGSLRKQTRRPGVFLAEELPRLFPADPPGPWLDLNGYVCWMLAATTGMRRSELLALRWRNVDLGAGEVKIEEAWKDARMTELGPPKWGRVRDEPLSARAIASLRRRWETSAFTAANDLVLCDVAGRRLGPGWWTVRFRAGLTKAGIEPAEQSARNLKPHSFRHTFISLLRDRVHYSVLKEIVGHTDEATTDGYTRLSMDQKRIAADELDRLLG